MSSNVSHITRELSSTYNQNSDKNLSEQHPWYVFAHLTDAIEKQDADALAKAATFIHNALQLQALVYTPATIDIPFEEGLLTNSPAQDSYGQVKANEVEIVTDRDDLSYATPDVAIVSEEEEERKRVETETGAYNEEASERSETEPAVPDAAVANETALEHNEHLASGTETADDSSNDVVSDSSAIATEEEHPLLPTQITDASQAKEDSTADKEQQESELKQPATANPTEEPVEALANEQQAFLPYHTVDYFAALGIKIDPRLLTNSRLDTQMKSFTQWLKSMKRISYETAMQAEPDKDIQERALRSLQNNPVLTETMVEVLVKQNKTQQAVQLLEKLAGLHPEKSSLFAARIEALKQQL